MEKEKKIWTTIMDGQKTAFSSIKRMFGEYTSAIRFQNTVKEITMKISLYNLFRRIV